MPARCKRNAGGAAFSSYQQLWIFFLPLESRKWDTSGLPVTPTPAAMEIGEDNTTRSTNQKRGNGIKKNRFCRLEVFGMGGKWK
jgi:hypothetical protein